MSWDDSTKDHRPTTEWAPAAGAPAGRAGPSVTTLAFAVAIGLATFQFVESLVQGVLLPLFDSGRLGGFATWTIDVGSSTLYVGDVLVRALVLVVLAVAASVTVHLVRSRRS